MIKINSDKTKMVEGKKRTFYHDYATCKIGRNHNSIHPIFMMTL